MIDISTEKRNVRECTAEIEYGGEKHSVRVRFYDSTIAQWKKDIAELEHKRDEAKSGKKTTDPQSDSSAGIKVLARVIESLPDMTLNGKAFDITTENLEHLTSSNLYAIEKAIADSVRPKAQPSS